MAFNFQSLFDVWESFGFYDIILPLLLIFAIVFGILSYTKIFKEHKGINVLISLVIALMSARVPLIGDFLKEVSPRLGVGLIVLLVLIILVGLFTPEKTQAVFGWIFLAVGVVIALIIFGQVYNVLGFWGPFAFSDNLIGFILMIALLIGIIAVIVIGSRKGEEGRRGQNPIEKLASLWEGD